MLFIECANEKDNIKREVWKIKKVLKYRLGVGAGICKIQEEILTSTCMVLIGFKVMVTAWKYFLT